MTQEAIIEFDMDVFSRRLGPYLTWLESKIESGWEQSDVVPKDILKETKFLATTMRARFILGVNEEEFKKEVFRVIELLELAIDAFQGEGDDIEAKIRHLCKGVSGEVNNDALPARYQTNSSETEKVTIATVVVEEKIQTRAKILPIIEDIKQDIPQVKVQKPAVTKKKTAKKTVKKVTKTKAVTKKVAKVKKQKTTIVKVKPKTAKPEIKTPKPKVKEIQKKKGKSVLKKWINKFIYG